LIRSTYSADKGDQVRGRVLVFKVHDADLDPGFTPTSPLNTILPRTAEQMREIQWIDRYQADLFAGFSMRMLEDMGALALADPDVSYTTLTNPMQYVYPSYPIHYSCLIKAVPSS